MVVAMQKQIVVEGLSDLIAAARRYPYLARYIRRIASEVGFPAYYTKDLPSKLKKAAEVNVMYPVDDGVFIHIYMPPGGTVSGYRKYVIIEPPRPPAELFKIIEVKIAEVITEKDVAVDMEEKKRILLRILDKVVIRVGNRVDYKSILNSKKIPRRIPVYHRDFEVLKYYLIRDKVGLGVLDPLLKDKYIEDISCTGVGYIYIVHKIFGPLETNIKFDTPEELDKFVIELSERIGKPVSHARPIVDASLPDGSRINIVFGGDVSLKGSNFTIRKFSKVPISIIQIIDWGTMDELVAAYLWILLLEGMSGFISGETASGKTTTLNAIIAFIRPTAKIVSIEDTAEIQVPHENWVRELTRDTGSIETSVTMFDLLKAALRQRPNYIIVGEIRGAEGNVAFQAMQSVSWDTPVLIKDARTSEVRLVNIGEFVDSFYSSNEERIPKPVNNYLVLSMNRDGTVKWSKIKYVLRHKASKIYEITYEGKGTLKATGSHSVFVLDEETLEVRPKPVSWLKRGDLLVSFVKRHVEKIKPVAIKAYELVSKHGRTREVEEEYFRIRGSRKLSKQLVLDENLAFLLGAYLADGYIEHKNGKNPVLVLSMGTRESAIAGKAIAVAKRYDTTISVRNRGTYNIIRVYNAPLAYMISNLMGEDLSKKHIPSELWDSPPNVIKKFFKGYMADTSRTSIRGGIVVYTTKNKRLAIQLVWLARLAGLESKVFEISDKRYCKYYDIHVRLFKRRGIRVWSERFPLKPLINIMEKNGLVTKLPLNLTYIVRRYRLGKQRYVLRKTARKIIEFIEKYENKLDDKSRSLLDRARKLLDSDIAVLEVIDVREKEYNGYVYDISVPETELFIGGEVPIALHNTGHPVLATFHAASVERLVQRITSPPINVPKTQLDNLNFVVIQSAVYKEGVMLRRVLSVNEIIGYDPKADSIIFIPIFTWDPVRDRFTFRGKGTSYLLEEKIGTMRGLSRRNMTLIYEELNLRAKILRELVNKKVYNYYDVFRTIVRIYNLVDEKAKKSSKEEAPYAIIEGLNEALKRIRRGELIK